MGLSVEKEALAFEGQCRVVRAVDPRRVAVERHLLLADQDRPNVVPLGVVEDHCAARSDMLERDPPAFRSQVAVDDDEVEGAELRKEPADLACVTRPRIDRDVMEGHIGRNAPAQLRAPVRIFLDGDNLPSARRPPVRRLSSAKLKNALGPEILARQEFYGRVGVPRQALSRRRPWPASEGWTGSGRFEG